MPDGPDLRRQCRRVEVLSKSNGRRHDPSRPTLRGAYQMARLARCPRPLPSFAVSSPDQALRDRAEAGVRLGAVGHAAGSAEAAPADARVSTGRLRPRPLLADTRSARTKMPGPLCYDPI